MLFEPPYPPVYALPAPLINPPELPPFHALGLCGIGLTSDGVWFLEIGLLTRDGISFTTTLAEFFGPGKSAALGPGT